MQSNKRQTFEVWGIKLNGEIDRVDKKIDIKEEILESLKKANPRNEDDITDLKKSTEDSKAEKRTLIEQRGLLLQSPNQGKNLYI